MKRLFLLILLILLSACSSQKASLPTATPELLIKPRKKTPTPTQDWRESEAAIRFRQSLANRATYTPTYIGDENRVPIYNMNGELIGFVGDATPTAANINSSWGTGSEYSSSCDIKGNVNSKGDRIYHCPGWRDYSRTDVDESKGDQWFCSETEARAAGFRDPDYPHGACR